MRVSASYIGFMLWLAVPKYLVGTGACLRWLKKILDTSSRLKILDLFFPLRFGSASNSKPRIYRIRATIIYAHRSPILHCCGPQRIHFRSRTIAPTEEVTRRCGNISVELLSHTQPHWRGTGCALSIAP
ncbi:uncharacterized protein LAESUDRAFT_810405 [Laetiporus sulphureus 93-53]|uniref:Uncharacterized protein n=1 Tax=Laetiporus sulphureus 93-53 TaxID=1314785 RepID=A0A165GC04_9APHY|nr:uncharacterized protein LAESUDRAFT_810405 [Laetiporus sulphureus 93-53]KZT10135.1 hypothetical protein LAESUDRAFT_810405 [Laetiporus sulphureus 93-53]